MDETTEISAMPQQEDVVRSEQTNINKAECDKTQKKVAEGNTTAVDCDEHKLDKLYNENELDADEAMAVNLKESDRKESPMVECEDDDKRDEVVQQKMILLRGNWTSATREHQNECCDEMTRPDTLSNVLGKCEEGAGLVDNRQRDDQKKTVDDAQRVEGNRQEHDKLKMDGLQMMEDNRPVHDMMKTGDVQKMKDIRHEDDKKKTGDVQKMKDIGHEDDQEETVGILKMEGVVNMENDKMKTDDVQKMEDDTIKKRDVQNAEDIREEDDTVNGEEIPKMEDNKQEDDKMMTGDVQKMEDDKIKIANIQKMEYNRQEDDKPKRDNVEKIEDDRKRDDDIKRCGVQNVGDNRQKDDEMKTGDVQTMEDSRQDDSAKTGDPNSVDNFLLRSKVDTNTNRTEQSKGVNPASELSEEERIGPENTTAQMQYIINGENCDDKNMSRLTDEETQDDHQTDTSDMKSPDDGSRTPRCGDVKQCSTTSKTASPNGVTKSKNGQKGNQRGKRRKWKVPPPENFRGFAGKEDMLSNFYPCALYVYGKRFRSTEQAYQWRKAMVMGNQEVADKIIAAEHANQTKFIANKHFRGVNLNLWTTCRIPVMKQLLRAKARCCERFADELRDTGDRYIAEVVPRDRFWAIGDGTGKNVMGKLLMELRRNLDEALNADPDEDGKMVDFPDDDNSDLYTANRPDERTILLMGNSQLDGVDCKNMVRHIDVKQIITLSCEDAQNFIKNANPFEYSPVILHPFSYKMITEHDPEITMGVVCDLIDGIKRKQNNPSIILSLAVYPSLSLDSKYSTRADFITGQLFKRFNAESKVFCLRNALKLKYEECFGDDGRLTDIAEQQLRMNLMSKLNHHLFGTKHIREKGRSNRKKGLDKARKQQKEADTQGDVAQINKSENSWFCDGFAINIHKFCYLLICCGVVVLCYFIHKLVYTHN